MFRFVLFFSLLVLAVLFRTTSHVNILVALLFLALGGLLTSVSEDQLGYNFIDWLKDHALSLCGWFQTYNHAKIATLNARAAKIANKIMAEEQKIDAAIRRRL